MDKKKKDKMTNNDQQNTTQKTKDMSNTNSTNNRGKLGCSGRFLSAPRVAPVVFPLLPTR